MKKTIIIGGGTFQPLRNHLSLSAPAFGSTAKLIHSLYENSELYLTKMADNTSSLITNEDVELLIDNLVQDENVGTIILNVAFCDYKCLPIDNIESNFHGERLRTENGDINLTLTPTNKIISKIRKQRPDIFLVGFKTTTNKTPDEQFLIGLKMMKSVKCNLVLANDTVTRNNIIITAEESIYGNSTNREEVIKELVDMTKSRSNGTYNSSVFIEKDSININNTPKSFQIVIDYLINNGGFIENNGNGFTPGHFCWRESDKTFLSSQRKANHNLVFKEGMSRVEVNDDIFTVYGRRKASVGARSQWLILQENKDYDCIIHTHNPLKMNSLIPVTPQKPYQCGSLECGLNTVNNMGNFNNIKAVYLDKHGANILFKSTSNPKDIIDFIVSNINLGIKVK